MNNNNKRKAGAINSKNRKQDGAKWWMKISHGIPGDNREQIDSRTDPRDALSVAKLVICLEIVLRIKAEKMHVLIVVKKDIIQGIVPSQESLEKEEAIEDLRNALIVEKKDICRMTARSLKSLEKEVIEDLRNALIAEEKDTCLRSVLSLKRNDPNGL